MSGPEVTGPKESQEEGRGKASTHRSGRVWLEQVQS